MATILQPKYIYLGKKSNQIENQIGTEWGKKSFHFPNRKCQTFNYISKDKLKWFIQENDCIYNKFKWFGYISRKYMYSVCKMAAMLLLWVLILIQLLIYDIC